MRGSRRRARPPLPRLTPHGLRRMFASVLYAIGETSPVVMAELGHTDPGLALSIYAHAMRRDDGDNERLKALVDGVELGDLVTSDHSEEALRHAVTQSTEAVSRSTSGV
jgi:hypothetical protein